MMPDLSIDRSNLENSFDRIANSLFNEYVLQVGLSSFLLTEIEFYYNEYTQSVDNFAHKHGEDYLDGTWRLHGAGLDIVLKKTGTYYGGILIRGIQQLDKDYQPINNGIIDGPWNAACHSIKSSGFCTNSTGFRLRKHSQKNARKFKKSPRVGLFLKNPEDLEYICKPWRYNSTPIYTKKYRHLLFLQLYINNDSYAKEIVPNKKTQENYIKNFNKGKTMSSKAFIGLKNTVAHNCQLFGHYIKKYS